MKTTPINLDTAKLPDASLQQKRDMLRQAVQEMVGQTFYGQMLKISRNSALKGTIGHGGRGEQIFGAQLDAELARRVGQASRNDLTDAIYDRLVDYVA